ncbi:MAG TPA: hypothetical protein VGM90_19310 [Kofleriaceae bacterium]
MRSAFERGDLDETQRQGELAGPAVVDKLLRKHADRTAVLAGITAAPYVEDRAELLAPLADLAAGPDRRTAIPAALAAVRIARWFTQTTPADDLAADDVVGWRDRFAVIAMDPSRWIEVRAAALEVSAALSAAPILQSDGGIGVALGDALKDPDPAFRAAVITALPVPVPATARAVVAALVASDPNADVALAAAAALCADTSVDPSAPIIAAIGEAGIARITKLVDAKVPGAHDAKRCLKK